MSDAGTPGTTRLSDEIVDERWLGDIERVCDLLADPNVDLMEHMGMEEALVTSVLPILIASHRTLAADLAQVTAERDRCRKALGKLGSLLNVRCNNLYHVQAYELTFDTITALNGGDND